MFLIPAESGEKITLGISTMLNMTVFLMTVMSGKQWHARYLTVFLMTVMSSKQWHAHHHHLPNDGNVRYIYQQWRTCSTWRFFSWRSCQVHIKNNMPKMTVFLWRPCQVNNDMLNRAVFLITLIPSDKYYHMLNKTILLMMVTVTVFLMVIPSCIY